MHGGGSSQKSPETWKIIVADDVHFAVNSPCAHWCNELKLLLRALTLLRRWAAAKCFAWTSTDPRRSCLKKIEITSHSCLSCWKFIPHSKLLSLNFMDGMTWCKMLRWDDFLLEFHKAPTTTANVQWQKQRSRVDKKESEILAMSLVGC